MKSNIVPLLLLGLVATSSAVAQQPLVIKPLAERKVAELPPGPLVWRIESFADVGEAQAAATPWSLIAQSAGKVWLFTLGATGAGTPRGNKVAEVGPIAPLSAPEYLLRINEATGSPGSITAIHSHPGSEAFFVLSGEQSIRGPQGVMRVAAGKTEAGAGADIPMQVSSSGSTDLHALVMFVVDASRPFSTPGKLP